MNTYIHFWSYLAQFFLEWEMFQTIFVYKTEKIICSTTYFQKLFRLLDNVEKPQYSQTGYRWQYNIEHALCMRIN